MEADDVGLTFAQPMQKILQPFISVVDIESGDLHRSALNPQGPSDLSEYAGGKDEHGL
jgi:hypothetical protein